MRGISHSCREFTYVGRIPGQPTCLASHAFPTTALHMTKLKGASARSPKHLRELSSPTAARSDSGRSRADPRRPRGGHRRAATRRSTITAPIVSPICHRHHATEFIAPETLRRACLAGIWSRPPRLFRANPLRLDGLPNSLALRVVNERACNSRSASWLAEEQQLQWETCRRASCRTIRRWAADPVGARPSMATRKTRASAYAYASGGSQPRPAWHLKNRWHNVYRQDQQFARTSRISYTHITFAPHHMNTSSAHPKRLLPWLLHPDLMGPNGRPGLPRLSHSDRCSTWRRGMSWRPGITFIPATRAYQLSTTPDKHVSRQTSDELRLCVARPQSSAPLAHRPAHRQFIRVGKL